MNKSLLSIILIFTTSYIAIAQSDSSSVNVASDSSEKNYTGSSSVVTVKQYYAAGSLPEYNFTRFLDGAAPGIQTTNGGGQPGTSTEILIRGLSSLSDNNAPFIVLDGMPYYGNYSSINTNDIATIYVLKDATATFDFGNRGGNGILNITTRKKVGGTQNIHNRRLKIDAKFGISTQALSDYKTLGIQEFYETTYAAMQNAGQTGNVVDYLGGYNAYHINGVGDSLQNEFLIEPATGKLNPNAQLKYKDNWRKEMRRVGIRQNYNIAASAANDKGGYYLSAGYLNDKGYVHQTGYNRFSARFNGNYRITEWLQLGIRTQGTIDEQHFAADNLFESTLLMAPVYPVYYRNNNNEKEKDPLTGMDKFDWGSLDYQPNSSIGNRPYELNSNSIAALYLDNHSNKTSMFVVNPYLEIKFLKDFTYTANFSYNYNKTDGKEIYNADYGQLAQNNGSFHDSKNNLTTKSFLHKLVLDKDFKRHHLNWTSGNEYYWNNTDFMDFSGTGSGLSSNYSMKAKGTNTGYFSKLQYDYHDKYLLFAGIRRDGKYIDNTWMNQWVAGAAYVISEERFMKDIFWINQLKLKGSYGMQGRYFPNYSQLNMPGIPNPPSTGIGKAQYGAPNMGNQLNVGLESNLFNNRLYFEVNIYNRNSGEAIVLPYYTFPPFGPKFNYRDRSFEYNNKGIEFNLYTTNIERGAFTWTSNFILTHNKNKIASMPVGIDSLITVNYRIYMKGNSMADFYLVEYAGVDANNGDALYYTRDANGNEIKTSDYQNAQLYNRKNLGSALPVVYGSLTNNFTYRNFEFAVQLNYSAGGKYYDQIYQDLMSDGYNLSTDIQNQWTPDNRNTDVPRTGNYTWNAERASSRFLKNASYLSISNLYVGYSFNEDRVKKMKMKSIRMYLTANNIWMFASSKGMNPQGSFYGTPGYVYLPSRNIMLGLNIGI